MHLEAARGIRVDSARSHFIARYFSSHNAASRINIRQFSSSKHMYLGVSLGKDKEGVSGRVMSALVPRFKAC